MKRGTVIKADHARWVRYPSCGTLLVVGIGPPISWVRNAGPARRDSLVHRLRDFFAPGEYVPAPWQDDLGWHEPPVDPANHWSGEASGGFGQDGYSAHKYYRVHCKFRKILTIKPENIKSIDW